MGAAFSGCPIYTISDVRIVVKGAIGRVVTSRTNGDLY